MLVTTEAKAAVSTSAFSVSPVSRSSAPLSCGALFFPSRCLVDDTSATAFLVALHLPCQIPLHLGFDFPNPICVCLVSASIIPLGPLLLLPPLQHEKEAYKFS